MCIRVVLFLFNSAFKSVKLSPSNTDTGLKLRVMSVSLNLVLPVKCCSIFILGMHPWKCCILGLQIVPQIQ